jgi:hypothetical protein
MKTYIDNYDINILKTKLSYLDKYKLSKNINKYKKIITKYDGIYHLYNDSIFKLNDSHSDLNKIFFLNYKNSPIDIVIDENKIIFDEIYSHIPLNHFILPITEYEYSIYNKQINLKMIVEITNNDIPFDFYFISKNNILSYSYLQEEFETFLNILF